MADNLLDKASILLTPTAYNDGSMLSVKPENGDGDFTFSRGGNASRTNSSGNIVTESANIPRIDYTDGCGSWLLEGQSTNLITQSELFSDASWGKQDTIVDANSIISADGTQNASKIQSTQTGSALVSVRYPTLTVGNTYTFSCFAKKGNNDWIRLAHISSGGTGCWFDLENGVVGTVNSQSATIEDYGNGWYKCTNTFIAIGSTHANLVFIGICDADGSTNAGIVGQNDYLWGAQLEQQSYATSYIPTNGSIATRLADVATNSGNSSLINSTEGVLYAEIAALADNNTENRISLSYNNQNYVRIEITDSKIRFAVFNNGAYQAQGNYTASNITDFNKIAVKYKENDFALWVNGTEVGTDTSGLTSFAAPLDHLNFSNASGSNQFFKGKVRDVQVFPTALSDAELLTLTTI